MSSNNRIEKKIEYLNLIINYDKQVIDDFKEDLDGSSFETKSIIYNKIEEYRNDIEDTLDIIKELILREEDYQDENNQQNNSSDSNESFSSDDSQNIETNKFKVYDDSGKEIVKEKIPKDVKEIVNRLFSKDAHTVKENKKDNKIPTLIDFKTFMELYGTLIILNDTKGIGVMEKGGSDLSPQCMDLVRMDDGSLIAKNITSFEQLYNVLKS